MRQTLFFIPHELAGVPVFGVGWLFWLWLGSCLLTLWHLWRKHGLSDETKSFLPFAVIVALAIVFVLPMVEVPGRGLPIRGYGVFLLVATISGVLLAVRRATQVGLAPDAVFGLAFYMFVGGILGARLFFVIQYWNPPPPAQGIYNSESWLKTLGNVVNFVEGGLVVYGSLVGALIAAVLFLRKHKLPLLPMADLIAPSLALGLAIGRLGCLMNGCCYGGITDHWWAIRFPPESPPYFDQQRSGLFYGFRLGEDQDKRPVVAAVVPQSPAARAGITAGEHVESVDRHPTANRSQAQLELGRNQGELELTTNRAAYRLRMGGLPEKSLPVHPTQIYSSINALLLCFVVLAYFPFRRRDGETFALLLGLYSVTRFLLEVIRTDEPGLWNTGMTISQNVSVIMLVFVAFLAVYIARQPRESFWPRPSAE